MLITLYGINNIGKSTQALRLVEGLKAAGQDAVYVKFPVYDLEPTGSFLYKFLRSGEVQKISEEELQLWFALNRYQFEPTLKNWLSEGKIVIAEDYVGTGVAWGTVKGASTEWLEEVNKFFIQPDLSILLDGNRAEAAIEKGHLHEDNNELIQRSRQIHLELAERYDWTVVPVQPSIEETGELIWRVVELHLGKIL